jgi:chromosome segregation ATPase
VFEQLPGAEIQLEFRRQTEGDLQLVLRPEFHENRTEEFPMTLSRLADLKKSMEKRIPEDEAKFVVLGKEIKALNQQLKDLGPRPGGVAFAAWQTKVNSLQSGISSKSSQMSRISRRLPELKARLAAVPEMERFLREMHQKAALEMRVYAECGDAKLVLIDAHLDPAASDQQPGT